MICCKGISSTQRRRLWTLSVYLGIIVFPAFSAYAPFNPFKRSASTSSQPTHASVSTQTEVLSQTIGTQTEEHSSNVAIPEASSPPSYADATATTASAGAQRGGHVETQTENLKEPLSKSVEASESAIKNDTQTINFKAKDPRLTLFSPLPHTLVLTGLDMSQKESVSALCKEKLQGISSVEVYTPGNGVLPCEILTWLVQAGDSISLKLDVHEPYKAVLNLSNPEKHIICSQLKFLRCRALSFLECYSCEHESLTHQCSNYAKFEKVRKSCLEWLELVRSSQKRDEKNEQYLLVGVCTVTSLKHLSYPVPAFHKSFYFSKDKLTQSKPEEGAQNNLHRLLLALNNLTSVVLDFGGAARTVPPLPTQLKKVALLNNPDISVWAAVVPLLSKDSIEELDLTGCTVPRTDEEKLTEFCESIGDLKALKTLRLKSFMGVDASSVHLDLIKKLIESASALETLDLSDNYFTSQDAIALLQLCAKHGNLKTLDFKFHRQGKAEKGILDAIRTFKHSVNVTLRQTELASGDTINTSGLKASCSLSNATVFFGLSVRPTKKQGTQTEDTSSEEISWEIERLFSRLNADEQADLIQKLGCWVPADQITIFGDKETQTGQSRRNSASF